MPGVAPELQRRPLVLLAVRHGHDVNERLHRGGGHQGLLHRILPVGAVAVSPASRAPYAQRDGRSTRGEDRAEARRQLGEVHAAGVTLSDCHASPAWCGSASRGAATASCN